MPLYEADSSIDHINLWTVPDEYIIFYSSVVDGQMWCPDCRRVDSLIKETFGESGPSALIVYTGNREQWKAKTNIWRQEAWNITSVPTIVRLKNGKEESRLVDDGPILSKLSTWTKS
ncbi:hypothetical protein D9619_002584 [Psilocybe cf. subviscida]|uniref:Thioredoxin domain-containing protein n=1 Tax=Psilocybe cf. subviscida TaxID=2480587 RepID=A0A8H5ETL3_9AGAR|nr:hypothetical protein D9619_002584 [Psilocybe cf. subviscida]